MEVWHIKINLSVIKNRNIRYMEKSNTIYFELTIVFFFGLHLLPLSPQNNINATNNNRSAEN